MFHLRSFKLLLVVLLIGVALAALERRQIFLYNHLSERMNSRGHPSLKGGSLKKLADVLYELYPDRAEANLFMGRALIEKGRLKDARKYLEEALELDRNNQQLLFLYAQLLLDMGEEEDEISVVVNDLRQLFPRSKKAVEAYFERASKGKLQINNGLY
jgi:tetratricopeptide (TPR) repeat protein|tara:strand:+ start:188 stop:661 length:474 start_codon:yes stop_codon:yes gene_type:complete